MPYGQFLPTDVGISVVTAAAESLILRSSALVTPAVGGSPVHRVTGGSGPAICSPCSLPAPGEMSWILTHGQLEVLPITPELVTRYHPAAQEEQVASLVRQHRADPAEGPRAWI